MEAQQSLLMPIQDLFKFSVFQVPNYQRGYAWGSQQVNDLLSDLEDIDPGRTHYTGTIVLVKKGEQEHLGETYAVYDVVDGQQRLTTVLIILQCIYEEYERHGDGWQPGDELFELAKAMRENYILKGNTEKLILNKDSNDYFRNHVIKVVPGAAIDSAHNRSEENLKNARSQIKDHIRSRVRDGTSKKNLDDLDLFRRRITNGLMVNRYVVDSDSEAGVIFEVMNDRGKALSNADKIKNYLIYLAYKIEVSGDDQLADRINDYWGEIFRYLMASRRSSEDEFLRYHWITYTNEQRESDIHRRVKHFISLKDITGRRVNQDIVEKRVNEYALDLKESSQVFFELNW